MQAGKQFMMQQLRGVIGSDQDDWCLNRKPEDTHECVKLLYMLIDDLDNIYHPFELL